MVRWLVVLILAGAVGAVACGGDDDGGSEGAASGTSTPVVVTPNTSRAAATPGAGASEGNLFVNPGLEEGDTGWTSLQPDASFVVSTERAQGGSSSALLRMRDPAEAGGIKVYYLVQEISPELWPDEISGAYRVENWAPGSEIQYVQFVVVAFGPSNMPDEYTNWQIRYPLAGLDEPPYQLENARFQFLGSGQPRTGEWIQFRTNIREDFERAWGVVPENFEKIRVLFEVRWEEKVPGAPASADVYYDDLYIGPGELVAAP